MSIDGSAQSFRGPWEGDTKLVMGIDIGPTYSGVAFTLLHNDENPTIHRVTSWPGQEAHRQQSRIPTLIWYDKYAKAMAFGAEARSYAIEAEAEDNGWILAKNFKLHLHPTYMQAKHELKLDPLPPGVTLRQIYSDFLRYLLSHTREYFEDRILDGKTVWERCSPVMEVVIAHPNGWGTREQGFLRLAAVAAGFSTINQASSKIQFVTEAEASVHFCIHNSNLNNFLQSGINFLVCDAGGSTVDTTLYSVASTSPVLQLQEKRASACVQAGAIFVDFEAEMFLHMTLANAGLPQDEVDDYTRAGVKDFESMAKRAFRDETSEQTVQVAHSRFNNPTIKARRGRITLSGPTVKGFFDVCVKDIILSVNQQMADFHVPFILLVGGFGDSPYLRQEFRKCYEPRGCEVTCTNDSSSKAVADGAVLWAMMHGLVSRTLQLSWGIETTVAFNPNDPDHLQRKEISSTSGWNVVPGRWKGFATKATTLDKNAVVRIPFSLDFPSPSTELGPFQLIIYSYSGDGEPGWMRNKQGKLLPKFRNAATIQTTLEGLRGALEPSISLDGSLQWQLDFNVCMRFGDTELEAYLEWQEKGNMREGSRTIIPPFDEA